MTRIAPERANTAMPTPLDRRSPTRPPAEDELPEVRSWGTKFRDALRGIKHGVRGQSSFFVHFFATAMVVAFAVALGAELVHWCLLVLCVAIVLTAEMFNTAIESLGKAVSERHHPHVGAALDIASGAVLIASLGAAVVGGTIFVHLLGRGFGWW